MDQRTLPTMAGRAFILAVGIACLAARAQAPSGEASDVDVEVYRASTLQDFNPLPYPSSELSGSREGWVITSFMVDSQGKPYEIAVVDSMGGKPFEKAAIRSVERSAFTPATVGGKAIDSGNTLKLKFAIRDLAKGADGHFVRLYSALGSAVNKGDREAADKALQAMEPDNLYEDAFFHFGRFRYHVKWGTETQQLEDLRAAIAGEAEARYFSRKEFATMLAALLKLEVARNEFGKALETWRLLEKHGTAAQNASWLPVMEKVRALQTSNAPIRLGAEIGASGSWWNRLFRRRFQIVVLDGRVADIKLRCEKSYLLFHFDPALEYTVKNGDGACDIEVIGDAGTRFQFVQT